MSSTEKRPRCSTPRPVLRLLLSALVLVSTWCSPSLAGDRERIEALEQQVQELRSELARARTAGPDEKDRLAEIEHRIEVLAAEIERLDLGEAAASADRAEYGLGPAASKVYRAEKGVSLGGYGEMLYENYASQWDDGSQAGKSDQLDFLRAVIYVGYKFNHRWLFNSEIEFEHASTGESGSVSVEFAYLDYLWREQLGVRGGLLLLPMGFINELHEPTVFLGARRPDVERLIIPSTWREGGVGVFGDLGPVSYRSYVVNGLRADGFSSSGLRGGRQKGSKALAEDFAWVGRADYRPRPGLTLGASYYAGNSGQNLKDAEGAEVGVLTTIFEGHAEWRWRGLEFRTLGVTAALDDVDRLNQVLGLEGLASVGEKMSGGYVQLGYDLATRWSEGGPAALIPFFRWEAFDTQAEVPDGYQRNPARDVRSLTLGLSFKPLEQLVLKADYQDYHNEAGTGLDQFNLALGYVF